MEIGTAVNAIQEEGYTKGFVLLYDRRPLCTINAYFITYYQELKVQYYFMQVKYELLDLNELKFVALHQIILLQIIYTSIN